MGYTDKAVQAHMASILHAGLSGLNEKIADITHADTNKHTITLAALGLPDNAIGLLLTANRVSGTGSLRVYPIEGTLGVALTGEISNIVVINNRLQYDLTVANDDFDLYCIGYFTAGQVLG